MALNNIPRHASFNAASNGSIFIATPLLLWTAALTIIAPATVTTATLTLNVLGEDGIWRPAPSTSQPAALAAAAVNSSTNYQQNLCPCHGLQLVITAYTGSGNIWAELTGVED